MAHVEIRDHALWIAHVHGDTTLTECMTSLMAGDLVELEVDGHRGVWKKMEDGKDGRSTPGIRPIGKAKDVWLAQQERRGEVVTIYPVSPAGKL